MKHYSKLALRGYSHVSEYYDAETARSSSRAELLNLEEEVRRVSRKQHKHGWCYGGGKGSLNRGAILYENSDLLDSYSRIYLILGWGTRNRCCA